MLAAKILTRYFFVRGEIQESEREIFQYGFELILSTLFVFITVMCSSLLFFEAFDGIIFTMFFYHIRIFSGGYHADKYYKCYLYSVTIFILIALVAKIFVLSNFMIPFIMILISYLYIYQKLAGHSIENLKGNMGLQVVMFINLIIVASLYFINMHYFTLAIYTTCAVLFMQIAYKHNVN